MADPRRAAMEDILKRGRRITDEEFQGIKDPTTQEVPQLAQAKTDFDEWLTNRVVDPIAQRGYPNLGAALGTIGSVGAEVLIPTSGADIAMPGVAKLGRMGKAAKREAQAINRSRQLKNRELEDALFEGRADEKELRKIMSHEDNLNFRNRWDQDPGFIDKPQWYKDRAIRVDADKRKPGYSDALDNLDAAHDTLQKSSAKEKEVWSQLGQIQYQSVQTDLKIKRRVEALKQATDPQEIAELKSELGTLNQFKEAIARQAIELKNIPAAKTDGSFKIAPKKPYKPGDDI